MEGLPVDEDVYMVTFADIPRPREIDDDCPGMGGAPVIAWNVELAPAAPGVLECH